MANKRLENLYSGISREVYPRIRNQKRGVLYTLIHILLEPEASQADVICRSIDIREDARREDDKRVVNDLMNNPEESLINQFNPFNDRSETDLFWIVVIACSLVGVYACLKYLKRVQDQRARQKQTLEPKRAQAEHSPPKSLTAALCLVVPASATSNLNNNLDSYDLEQLIDSASYFLCTTIDDANLKQQRLELTNEAIPIDGNRDIYIRIHIPNSQELIDKKLPYILKRNLPSHEQGLVNQLACLKSLSGLEEFNRI